MTSCTLIALVFVPPVEETIARSTLNGEKRNPEITTRELQENDHFGEPMLVRRGAYPGTVVASKASKVLRLRLATIENLTGSLVGRSGRA